jgi:large subunit ribosomal protein L15
MPEKYFGKNGFHSPKALHSKENAINLNKLQEVIQPNQTEINLTEMGFTKLLGTGKITNALTITVANCSKIATSKIEGAGGKVITESEEETETAEPEQ